MDMFCFPLLQKSTRVWDTFAEPNNKTIPSVAFNQNQASFPTCRDPRPKNRLTEEGCDCGQLKTCLLGVQKHLTKFGGFFYFCFTGGRTYSSRENAIPDFFTAITSAGK